MSGVQGIPGAAPGLCKLDIAIPTLRSRSSTDSAAISKESRPIEVRSLVRTLLRWKQQIAAWHGAHVSNGPVTNNSVKCVKRVAFGPLVRNYRVRVQLHAGKPSWDLLAAITPR